MTNNSNEKDINIFNPNSDDEISDFSKEASLHSINFSTKEIYFPDISNAFIGNKRNKYIRKHTKFSNDNLKRECKHLVIESVMKFINDKIDEVYGNNIGCGISVKRLFKINQSQKTNSDVAFNKQFIQKTLKEILSDDITGQIKLFERDHNKRVINIIIDEKREVFEKIFNLTFIECLKHFIEIEQIEELNGLTLFTELKEQLIDKYKEDGEAYYENLKIFLMKFEELINKAKPRKKRQKKNLIISR